MASKMSLLVNDITSVFESGYKMHANFIVSCMFANLGLYSIAENSSLQIDSVYEQSSIDIYTSHVWYNLPVISSALKYSMLHTTVCKATPYTYIMDDKKLSKGLLNFKEDVAALMKKHATFLAYCDAERSELFGLVNGIYAYDKNMFDKCLTQTTKDIKTIYFRYKGKVPKVVMYILDDIQELVDIRSFTHGNLSHPTDFSWFPTLPKFKKERFHESILKFTHGNLHQLMKPLKHIYRHCVPFYVLSHMQELFTIHGEKHKDMDSIADKLNINAIESIRIFKRFMTTHGVAAIRKDIQYMPIFANAFDVIDNDTLFDDFSFEPIGSFVLNTFTYINNFLQQNIQIIVLSDLLHCGLFSAVSKQHQLDVEQISNAITSCEYSFERMYDEVNQYSCLNSVTDTIIHHITCALKRVKRYEQYLRFITDTEELPAYIDMIFGNVYDDDGSPTTCAICLDDSTERKDTWFQLPCNHKFHFDCVEHLVCSCDVAKCPLCRVDVY